jgi:hypothetical protein
MDIIKKTLEILTNPEKFKDMSEKEQDQFIDEFIEYLKNSKDKMNQAMSFLRFGGHGKAQSITDYMDEIGEESFKKFFKEVILDGKIKTSIGYVNSDNEIKELPFSELDSFFNDMEDFGLTEEQCMEQYSLCYCCDVIREEQKKIGETDDTGKEIKVDTVFNPKPFLQGFYNLFMAFSLIGKDNQFKSLYEKRGIEMAIASLDKKNAEFANYVAKYFKEKNVDGNIAIFNALYFCLVTLTALKPIMFSKNEDDLLVTWAFPTAPNRGGSLRPPFRCRSSLLENGSFDKLNHRFLRWPPSAWLPSLTHQLSKTRRPSMKRNFTFPVTVRPSNGVAFPLL